MHPTLYQVSARLLLAELGERLGQPATLADVEDEQLDLWASRGFDWIWLLGVWQTGPAGRQVSQTSPQWQAGYAACLPDFTAADVCGSPFAVQAYAVHEDFGGAAALAQFRDRLKRRGLRLMLDFVPNHMARDHRWVTEHPEYFIAGTEADLQREGGNFVRVDGPNGPQVLAYGRDPYFPGWPDTLQLNYRHAGLREAMIGELQSIATQCDGVRCDMAMLLLPDVIQRTWGERSNPRDGSAAVDAPFWPEAIGRVRTQAADFTFLSEVYWGLEGALQQQGFDYTYDKLLYDRLRDGEVEAVREHLQAGSEFQSRCARFLENHDEPRAATVFETDVHRAAAVAAFAVPGMRFFHDGQLDGRRSHASIHLSRRAAEGANPVLRDFYGQLLQCLRSPEFRYGAWRLLDRRPAWDGNETFHHFLTYQWRDEEGRRAWVVVNFGPSQGQCFVEVGDSNFRGKMLMLRDQLSRAWYERDGNDLADRGLFVDMPAWGYHIFDVTVT